MILLLLGTKAQLVKMAPVIREIRARDLPYRFVLTGQHAETIDSLLKTFDLPRPDDVLVKPDECDSSMRLLAWLHKATYAARQKGYSPGHYDILLVHGDTLSTLFGAVLGRLTGIPVAHVEGGLRSHRLFHPFPEEIVRLIVSRLSQFHYCGGPWAVNNLHTPAPHGAIIDTGLNTILDSLRFAVSQSQPLGASAEPYCVVSIHRTENLLNRARLDFLMETLLKLAERIATKFVLHPATKRVLNKSGWNERLAKIPTLHLLHRTDYVRFVKLLQGARFLLTDGGSNQEEASYLGLPCLLLRKHTERLEGLGDNVTLSQYDAKIISDFVDHHIGRTWEPKSLPEIYPSKAIVDHLELLLRGA